MRSRRRAPFSDESPSTRRAVVREVRGGEVISGVELRKEREEAGVTASAIARGMGVSPQYVSKVERYEFVTGDLLAHYRAAIEVEVAMKEGRNPVKSVPQA